MQHLRLYALAVFSLAWASGCGTTRMSDTGRTGTEQLLVSTAVDIAINRMNFEVIRGREVYLDAQYLRGTVDENYVVSSLRQHLLAAGCTLKDRREEAMYVVEARSGAVGTNRHEVMIGVPSVNLPVVSTLSGAPAAIPEIPFAKTTSQKGVAKLAVFVYNQRTGEPLWQSGTEPVVATAKDSWVLGTGPFQRGTIYTGTGFAGNRLLFPFARDKGEDPGPKPDISVTAEARFREQPQLARANVPASVEGPPAGMSVRPSDSSVVPASGVQRLPPVDSAARPAVAAPPPSVTVDSGMSWSQSGSPTAQPAARQDSGFNFQNFFGNKIGK